MATAIDVLEAAAPHGVSLVVDAVNGGGQGIECWIEETICDDTWQVTAAFDL